MKKLLAIACILSLFALSACALIPQPSGSTETSTQTSGSSSTVTSEASYSSTAADPSSSVSVSYPEGYLEEEEQRRLAEEQAARDAADFPKTTAVIARYCQAVSEFDEKTANSCLLNPPQPVASDIGRLKQWELVLVQRIAYVRTQALYFLLDSPTRESDGSVAMSVRVQYYNCQKALLRCQEKIQFEIDSRGEMTEEEENECFIPILEKYFDTPYFFRNETRVTFHCVPSGDSFLIREVPPEMDDVLLGSLPSLLKP